MSAGAALDYERARSALAFIPSDDRDLWVRMAMAVKSELGDAGFDLWDAWSRQSDRYNERDARDVWRSCKANGGVSVGSLYHEAKGRGWRDDGTHHKPTAEKLEARRHQAAARAAKEEAERTRKHAEAAKKARAVWAAATPLREPHPHPYLTSKRVPPVPTLKEIHAAKMKEILGYQPQSRGETLVGRLLVVPVEIGGELSSAALIDENGRKAFLRDGAAAGGYWAAQALPDGDGAGLTILVAEGVATSLSAKEATAHLVIAALSSGNLPAVAKAMRERFPKAVLGILGDLGNGQKDAEEAAGATGAALVLPDFGEDRPEGATDVNDMHRHRGVETLAACIAAQMAAHAAQEGETAAGGDEARDGEPPPQARPYPEIPPLAELRIDPAKLDTAKLTPQCLVESYLYADAAVFPGPGGTGKTTLFLYEVVHIVLGKPLYGLEVRTPGCVVIVTAEDRRELLEARLREIMRAMDLSAEERAKVCADVMIWDVTGAVCRLTELDRQGNVVLTGLADAIVERFRETSPVVVGLDPAISFGAGERIVNDNEHSLILAARRIVRGLGCCVRLICHVSKEAARSGSLDQYASRGGSALSDGSRMVAVLRSFDPEATDDKLIPPPGLSFGADEQVMVLARPKVSYAPPQQPLIWITRRGYAFRHFFATRPDLEAEAKARADQLERFLMSELTAGSRYTRNTLKDTGVIKRRDDLRAALIALEAAGRIVDALNPKAAHTRGGARWYLHPVAFGSPNPDGEPNGPNGNGGKK